MTKGYKDCNSHFIINIDKYCYTESQLDDLLLKVKQFYLNASYNSPVDIHININYSEEFN